MNKILIETVQLFGETVTQYPSPTFYYNLPTNSGVYPALLSYFAAPTTMTDQIEVAIARKGMFSSNPLYFVHIAKHNILNITR